MTTMTPEPGFVTGGVSTHLQVHVAAAVDHLGGVLGTETFPTTDNGYRRLLRWLGRSGLCTRWEWRALAATDPPLRAT